MAQASSAEEQVDQIEQVREQNVESLIEAKEIGTTLRRLRLKRSMGLVELGVLSGLSASFLSQLETGRVVPTVRNLARLAMVFKVDLSFFFRGARTSRFEVSRGKDRVRLPAGPKGAPFMYSESMSGLILDRKLVPCVAELLPDTGEQSFESRLYPGAEFVFVMEGVVKISTDQRSELLEERDILWLDAQIKRVYRCAGETAAKVLIISFPS